MACYRIIIAPTGYPEKVVFDKLAAGEEEKTLEVARASEVVRQIENWCGACYSVSAVEISAWRCREIQKGL